MTTAETLEPPRTSVGVIGWLKKNLFSTWYNTALTLIALWFLYTILSQMIVWAFTSARWEVITANLRLFMVGPFPPSQVWRVWLVLCIVSTLMGLSGGVFGGTMRTFARWLAASYATLIVLDVIAEQTRPFDVFAQRLAQGGASEFWNALPGIVWLLINLGLLAGGWLVGRERARWRVHVVIAWFVSFFVTVALLQGFGKDTWLPEIGTNLWGGLLLTFMLAVVSIVVSFPLGVLLALGRRSKLPAIKIFCILYIELIRGVPLVTILYMTQIMLPLFLPGQLRIDNVTRAIAGMTLFTAAYLAENVRGGLQAIPTGQIEAAHALGLNDALTTLFIVLPQALRMVIPAIVGLFISLFKDTTLATIVALLELLGVARSVLAQAEFMGLQTEVYLFIAAIFFVFSYAMSFASYRVEEALGVGKR
ncbi:MAG: ABC transporter permease subunit [Anaerolineae bacterium]|nr:ABC transporter permease subunit [Anaerolineae bacterium]